MNALNGAFSKLGRAINLKVLLANEEGSAGADARNDHFAKRLDRLHDAVPGQLPEVRLFRP